MERHRFLPHLARLALVCSLSGGPALSGSGQGWERLASPADLPKDRPLRAAFLIVDGVYNSELMAPYDVLHHTALHRRPLFEELDDPRHVG